MNAYKKISEHHRKRFGKDYDMATKQVESRDFLDFTDFFRLLKDSMTSSHSNEDVFIELVSVLYDEAGISMGSPKDDVSDICRKKKAFNPQIRNVADNFILDKIMDTIKSPLIDWIIQLDDFIDKLLFLIKIDLLFFTENDYRHLEEQRNDAAYIIAFALIRTIACSDKSSKIKHPEDYNPFSKYNFPNSLFRNTDAVSYTKKDLKTTSKYIYESQTNSRKSLPPFSNSLLSNGIVFDAFQNQFEAEQKFAITTDCPDEKLLDDFLDNSEHLLIVGEGGIGKTTFMYTCQQKFHEEKTYDSIPIYIKLSECSTCTDHKHMILNMIYKYMGFAVSGNPSESFKDIIDEFCKPCTTGMPEYTILLDGFNEVSVMDFGEIRTAIAKEITTFLAYTNVRIILTSREVDFYGIPLTNFKIIKASGIQESDIIDYLHLHFSFETVASVINNPSLMQHLRIPLFLIMYCYSQTAPSQIPQSRGAILFYYFNSNNSFYNEKVNISDKSTLEVCLTVNIILDFLLPNIGYYMQSKNLFHINESTFEKLLLCSIEDASRFIGLHIPAYTYYESHSNSLRRTIKLFAELDYEDVLILLRDCICVISKDSDNHLYFNHQYIRDYFSALHCIKELLYLFSVSQHQPQKLLTILTDWGTQHWDNEHTLLVHEILSVPSEYQTNDLIYNCINLFRENRQYHIFPSQYALANLISVLALSNHGDLSKYDFSYLDLSNCVLTNLNFHDCINKQSSSFKHSTISKDTFAPDGHRANIMGWAVSDDERFIISYSTEHEIKVWNIATQKCIITRSALIEEEISSLDTLALYRNGTLALITFKNTEGTISVASTYDFTKESYTCYLGPDSERVNFSCFCYDVSNDNLLGLLYDGRVFKYALNNVLPTSQLPDLTSEFHMRLNTYYVTNKDYLREYPTKFKTCHVLRNDKLLYIESDVLAPYYHGIDNNIYKDSYPPSKTEDLSSLENPQYFPGAERHINYFIYDLYSSELNALQLDCTPNENTTLVICASSYEDVISNYTAISKDGSCIAIHNRNDIFVYKTTYNDYTFRTLCTLPYSYHFSLKYCHPTNDILTLIGNAIIHLDTNTGRILYNNHIAEPGTRMKAAVTPNYTIYEIYDAQNDSLQITNIYTELENSIRLSSVDNLTNTYLNPNSLELYALYENCTVLTLQADTLELITCYNYAPNRHIIAETYSEKYNLLCFASSPYHSYMYSSQNTITLVNLHTKEYRTSAPIFSSIKKIQISADRKYIVALSDLDLYLLDANTLTIINHCNPVYREFDRYSQLFLEDNKIHIVYTYELRIAYTTYCGIIVTYEIMQKSPWEPLKMTYLPLHLVKPTDPPLMVHLIDASGLSYVKSIGEDNNIQIQHRISDFVALNELDFRMHFESYTVDYPLSQWTLVYLINTRSAIGPMFRERDVDINMPGINFNPYHNENIVRIESDYFKHEETTNCYTPISSYIFEQYRILNYSRNLDTIYCYESESSKIWRYDINKGKVIFSSNHLTPYALTHECDFDCCKGAIQNITFGNTQKHICKDSGYPDTH